jgi:hypothetical protein
LFDHIAHLLLLNRLEVHLSKPIFDILLSECSLKAAINNPPDKMAVSLVIGQGADHLGEGGGVGQPVEGREVEGAGQGGDG